MEKEDLERVVEFVKIEGRKRDRCARKGHSNSKLVGTSGPIGSPRAEYHCQDCGEFYNRGLTDEQWRDYSDMIDKPLFGSA